MLDYYADVEPDRNYDIYSMTDDLQVCRQQPKDDHQNNAREYGEGELAASLVGK